MMELLFLRHGPAEPKPDWTGDDEERPLSAEGRLLVMEVAASLLRQQTRPERVLTSPYVRAQQTAHIVADRLGVGDRVSVDSRLAPGFGPKHLGKILREHGERRCILLVGHGPDLTQLVRGLTGGRLTIRKGGVAQVEVTDADELKGHLVSLIVPTPVDSLDGSTGDSDL